MLTVYIAERHYDYEGFDIIGVFDTYEAAAKANGKDTMGDGHKVTEHMVESETK